jgi:molecular chaperone DnaK (HSP70)
MNVGIDLGTTNSALAYIDPQQAADADYPAIQVLDVPQYVAQGRVEPRRTLPSFLHLGDQEYVGVYAREQGALVPTQNVHSAKSWLSNPEVDRTAKILPWDAQEAGRVLSPVEVSTRIIAHLAKAWSDKMGSAIGEQNVVLTVPASFDEEARELTVAAARAAGIEKLTLLEEPAAAFYSWIANDLSRSQKSLFDGQTVLVCDVGGGTSDFTLIRVSREGDRIDFTRTAVGKHLLLGGDNLDLTLAWLVEAKLGKTLSIRQRSGLRRQCAAAKERLLSEPNLQSVEVTVLGAGTSLVGGTLKTEITRDEVLELALDGFLPGLRTERQTERGRQEPLSRAGSALRFRSRGDTPPGGVSPRLQETRSPTRFSSTADFSFRRFCGSASPDVMEHWYGWRPVIFENRDLDLAVAVGRGVLLVRSRDRRGACWFAADCRARISSDSAAAIHLKNCGR